MRCAIIETEVREEVMQEMEARIMDMERVFAKRIKHAVSLQISHVSTWYGLLISCAILDRAK